jgi:hypothetical protein
MEKFTRIEPLSRPALRLHSEIWRKGIGQIVQVVFKCARIAVTAVNPFLQDFSFVDFVFSFNNIAMAPFALFANRRSEKK